MKYNVGDRVRIKSLDWYNKNKDEDGNIDINHDFTFYADRSRYCGKVFTIVEVFDNCYAVKEDNNEYYWSDEMIEGLVEEECPQDFIEKYCKSCGTQRCDRTEEYLNGCPYYNAYMCKKQNNAMEEETKPKFKEGDRITNGIATLTILTLASDRYIVEDNFGGCGTLYFNTRDDWKIVEEEVLLNIDDFQDDNEIIDIIDEYVHRLKDNECQINLPEGYQFKDENGNEILTSKIILEKKKKEYPKTFLGCCDVLGIEDLISRGVKGYKAELFDTLQKLYICRDAYWKIAGEEMGLGKPWEPDWTYNGATKYCIGVSENEIQNFSSGVAQYILAFPTEEMRDTFKKNFDPDIEICKEFL